MKDSIDFEAASRVADQARRLVDRKLRSQGDLQESLRMSQSLTKVHEHMDDTLRICEFLESQLAIKRGKFVRRYCDSSFAAER